MISVIVPVYRVEKYIHRCVDSILAQTFSDFELILVDDGSPDNSGKICDEYAEKNGRIRVIHKENGGLSSARNTGLDWVFQHSNSRWITFIDSDDMVHPRYLEALYHAVCAADLPISICSFVRVADGDKSPRADNLQYEKRSTEAFYCELNTNAVVAWGKLYRKEVFKDIRYPVNVLHEDEFVTYRLLFKNAEVAYVSAPLYYASVNEESITRSSWTPARLSALEGKAEQIAYMKANGYEAAYRRAVLDYAQVAYWQYIKIDDDSVYQKEKEELKQQLRKHLKKYRKLGVVTRRNKPEIYRVAFPNKMKLIGTTAVIKSRIYQVYARVKYTPRVMDAEKTIRYILKNRCSVSRFGDGEYKLMAKISDIGFQQMSDSLSERLYDVLEHPPKNLLLCVPNIFRCVDRFNERARRFWENWSDKKQGFARLLYQHCPKRYRFGDTMFTRPYIDYPDDANAKVMFPLIGQLWDQRDILIVEGEQTRMGVNNDLLSNAKSIQRILAPATDAFQRYDEILEAVLESADDRLILLALGPTATVMACELSQIGYQSIDIGHVDIEYEWYLQGAADKVPIPEKYTHESIEGRTFTPCNDPIYQKQIIKIIK